MGRDRSWGLARGTFSRPANLIATERAGAQLGSVKKPDPRHSDAARAMIANVALLSGQLDARMTAFETSIAAGGALPPIGLRSTDLQKELAALETLNATARSEAEEEFLKAGDWEAKGILARQAGRDDLAAQATRRAAEHRATGSALRTEVEDTEAALKEFRRILAKRP